MSNFAGYQRGNYQGQFNPNEVYDPQGAYKKKEQAVKTHIGTEDIREIVERLNAKPLNQDFTLVSFDELTA
jgi:hypothetical protein